MVTEAERRHLPLIELRRVVRFVEVTQSINGTLVNESVRRLQLADRVSHALAAGLADGAEVGRLMTILAAEVNADATLTAPNGDVIAEARADLAAPGATRAPAQDHPIVAPVSSAGVTVALLTLTPAPRGGPAPARRRPGPRPGGPRPRPAAARALCPGSSVTPTSCSGSPRRVGAPHAGSSSSPPGWGSTRTTRGCARWPGSVPAKGSPRGSRRR